MTRTQFRGGVDSLCVVYHGSETSGRRTLKHTVAVGGFAGDPHHWGFGSDVVWDDEPNHDELEQQATLLGLKAIFEASHTHFQPADFPPGPVREYGGETLDF